MHYLEVFVAEATYHRKEALTYSNDKPLMAGQLVTVPLQGKHVLGFVSARVQRPAFSVKPIVSAAALPPLPPTSLELHHWMRSYYPAPLGILTSLFLPQKLPAKTDTVNKRIGAQKKLPPLTTDQSQALRAISKPGLHLLHGDTGTGKTRVYIELAKRSIEKNKSALILTPEIGLTSQLMSDFENVFGNSIILLHSKLSAKQRQDIWVKCLEATRPFIVIGPRSALFSPVRNLGLIVVDESHEPAYKQDRAPYYHASTVAAKLAALHKATLVLGSATPLVSDYAIAVAKKRPVVRMHQIAAGKSDITPPIHLIDLRDRRSLTKSPLFSDKLIEQIHQTLSRGEQALLFLNRRGTARMIFCEQCGWQAMCPRCDISLVYHGDTHRMQCHTCAYRAASPASCPQCENTSIVFKSVGTKAVAEHAVKFFPEAKIQRFDTDNKTSERIEKHFKSIQRGYIDIIIGTQTVAKGLDLPKLGLVGVILADTGLSFPDFSASERTYQLLSQVIGRVGRGHRSSQVVIQTYNPESSVLKAVVSKNWNAFLDQELRERRQFRFPPFCYLLKLTCRRASATASESAGSKLVEQLKDLALKIEIEGPTPSFHEKIQNKYQWQIIVKASRRDDLLKVIAALPTNWSYDIDPLNLL